MNALGLDEQHALLKIDDSLKRSYPLAPFEEKIPISIPSSCAAKLFAAFIVTNLRRQKWRAFANGFENITRQEAPIFI